jgi:hypothetical protein
MLEAHAWQRRVNAVRALKEASLALQAAVNSGYCFRPMRRGERRRCITALALRALR